MFKVVKYKQVLTDVIESDDVEEQHRQAEHLVVWRCVRISGIHPSQLPIPILYNSQNNLAVVHFNG